MPEDWGRETVNEVGCSGHGMRPVGEGQASVVKEGEAGFGNVPIPPFRDAIVFGCMRGSGVVTYAMSTEKGTKTNVFATIVSV
jgi:hypothetical protein